MGTFIMRSGMISLRVLKVKSVTDFYLIRRLLLG
jgi:hypothetical protein